MTASNAQVSACCTCLTSCCVFPTSTWSVFGRYQIGKNDAAANHYYFPQEIWKRMEMETHSLTHLQSYALQCSTYLLINWHSAQMYHLWSFTFEETEPTKCCSRSKCQRPTPIRAREATLSLSLSRFLMSKMAQNAIGPSNQAVLLPIAKDKWLELNWPTSFNCYVTS